jgi:hypothetical protein
MQQSIKYYLYISDTKVDMLFNQIPQKFFTEYAGEIKIDLKLLGISINKLSSEQSKYEKILPVLRYLSKQKKIGTISQPSEYFSGCIPMRWGILGTKMAYFIGSEENTILGLGGSKYHLLGEKRELEIPYTGYWATSSAPSIIEQIGIVMLSEENKSNYKDLDIRLLTSATKELKGPIQNCEFVAKTLVRNFDREKNRFFLLGSPIYVALVE